MKKLLFAFLLLLPFMEGSAQAQVITLESHVPLDTVRTRALLNILLNFQAEDYYMSPNIPERKLKYALASCQVMSDKETVYALIDLTVSGKAKNCLLIAATGIYFHNGGSGTNPGRYFISYEMLSKCTVRHGDTYEVVIGPASVDMSGSTVTCDQLIALLLQVQGVLGSF